MSVDVEIKNEKFMETGREIERAVDRALADGAIEIQTTAQTVVPVDTGHLRASITTRKVGDLAYQIATNVEYSGFVEFGTRYMAAQPYLRPAFERHRKEIEASVRLAAAKASQ